MTTGRIPVFQFALVYDGNGFKSFMRMLAYTFWSCTRWNVIRSCIIHHDKRTDPVTFRTGTTREGALYPESIAYHMWCGCNYDLAYMFLCFHIVCLLKTTQKYMLQHLLRMDKTLLLMDFFQKMRKI